MTEEQQRPTIKEFVLNAERPVSEAEIVAAVSCSRDAVRNTLDNDVDM